MKYLQKLIFTFLWLTLALNISWSQRYDPHSGATYYPNGTIYSGNETGVGGPFVVVGMTPEAKGEDIEVVYCDEDPELCREKLEEAADDADKGGGQPGGSTGDSEESSSRGSVPAKGSGKEKWGGSPELHRDYNRYISKYHRMKSGLWFVSKEGKWHFISNPSDWTKRIYSKWK